MANERRSRFANPIVVLADSDVASRLGLWIESLLVSLVDEGLNPILLTPRSERDLRLAENIPDQAIAKLRMPAGRWPVLQHFASGPLVDHLAGESVRLVLSTGGRWVQYGVWLAQQLGVPAASLVTGLDEIGPTLKAASHLSAVLAGSNALAERLVARMGGTPPEGKVSAVGLGVHLGAGTAAFASPDRSVGIMAAGPLDIGSQFEQFILAASLLAEAHPDVVFSIVGAGPAEHGLRRMSEGLNLTDRLTFVPSVRRMDDLFDGVDIYVQPYVANRLDLRLLEAMAAGAVVLARNGGAVDFVRDGLNGLELTSVDEHGLAMLLAKLLDDPADGRRIGAQARQFVQENFLSGVSAQRVIERLRPIIVSRQTLKIS